MWGRNLSKVASNIQDSYQYAYGSDSNGERKTITTRNGTKVTEIEVDALGRILRGRLGNHVVNYAYNGTLQTISPVGQSSRTVQFDFLGRVENENHPETGPIDYTYDAAGRRTVTHKNTIVYGYIFDEASRLKTIRSEGNPVSERTYHPTYGNLVSATHGDVSVSNGDFDNMGRPQQMVVSIPAGLNGPAISWPQGDQPLSSIEANPRFEWQTIPGAANYQIEIRGAGQTWRDTTHDLELAFQHLGFFPELETVYQWRVRGKKSGDEIGPWSPWATFTVHGEPQIGLSTMSLNPSAPLGTTTVMAEFNVWNAGTGSLSFDISSDVAWLVATPETGISSGPADVTTIALTLDTSALGEAMHQGVVTVDGGAGVTQQTVQVNLSIYGEPEISTTPTSFTLSAEATTGPVQESLEIWNSGTGTLNYQVATSAGWMQLSAAAGDSEGPADRDTIAITLQTQGLAPGTYHESIQISGDSGVSPKTLPLTLTVFTEPEIGALPLSIAVTSELGVNHGTETLTLWNAGTGTLNFTLTDSTNWIQLSPTSGNSTGTNDSVSVSVNLLTAILGVGVHNATITIHGPSGVSPVQIPVQVTVEERPEIAFSAAAFDFSIGTGDGPLVEDLEIWNAGSGTLQYQINSSHSWISFSPSAGTSNGVSDRDTIAITFNSQTLQAGTHQGSLTLSGQTGVAPVVLPVSLVISDTPLIGANPGSFELAYALESGIHQESVRISNNGSGLLVYQLASDQPWLNASRTSGSLGAGGGHDIFLSMNANGLGEGFHQAHLQITGQQGVAPLTVPVRVTLSGEPVINTNPEAIVVESTLLAGPSDHNLEIWNSGTGTMAFTLSSQESWIEIAHPTGSSTGPTDRIDRTIRLASESLSEGVHQGAVTITAVNAAPWVVPVTVTVTGEPVIALNPQIIDLDFGTATGPHMETVAVWNSGTGTLHFTVSSSQSWLAVSPATGSSTGAGDAKTLQLTLATQGLPAGDHHANLVFSSNQVGVADVILPVNIHLLSEPLIGHTPAAYSLTLIVGEVGVNRDLEIWNAGTGTLNYQLAANVPWLSFSQTTGDSTGLADRDTVEVVFHSGLMNIGANVGLITLSASDPGVPAQTVPVTVTLAGDELSAVGQHWHQADFCNPTSGDLTDVSHFVIYINNNFACPSK